MKIAPEILILVGSPRKESRTLHVAEHVQNYLVQNNVRAKLWHQAQCPIPLMMPDLRSNPSMIHDENLQSLLHMSQYADAMVWATPVYHGSISGGLKNALDWLSSAVMKEKVVGFICHSGGVRKTHPLLELRSIARALGAHSIPQEVSTCDADFLSDQNHHEIISDDIKQRLFDFAHCLVDFSLRLQHNTAYVPMNVTTSKP